MCGFAGIINLNELDNGYRDKVRQLAPLLAKRGPDHLGFYNDNNASFVHARLSIKDPRPESHQPFQRSGYPFTLLYTGECYNYIDLKKDLKYRGYCFNTESDTEVIYFALAEWGGKALEKINGQFSFVFWDYSSRSLLIGRDRFGIKNLYYSWNKENLIFSTDLKPILFLEKEYQISKENMQGYLNYRYLPGVGTPFLNIFKVPPSSFSNISSKKEISFSKFWDIDKINVSNYSYSESCERLNKLIEDSVRLRCEQETPIVSYLSSGLDSSYISYFADLYSTQLSFLTLSTDKESDEWSEASLFAQKKEREHQRIFCPLRLEQELEEAIFHLEEPIGDNIIVADLLLAKKVSSKSRIVLAGEGADEIFGGYIHHKALYYSYYLKKLGLGHLGKSIIKYFDFVSFSNYPVKIDYKMIKHFINFLNKKNTSSSYYHDLVSFSEQENLQAITSNNLDKVTSYFKEREGTFFDCLMKFELEHWCPNYSLLRLDKIGGNNSVEARFPYLDHRVVELVLSLKKKYHVFEQKKTLRKAAKSISELRNISKKKKKPFIINGKRKYDALFYEFSRETIKDNNFYNIGDDIIDDLVERSKKEYATNKFMINLLNQSIFMKKFNTTSWKNKVLTL